MVKVIYDNTKNSDLYYAVQMMVPDAFFLFDFGDKQMVFLDHREYEVFREKNKNPNIEMVLLDPLLEKAKQSTIGNSWAEKLAYFLFKEYDLLDKEIGVPASFSLELADFLRSQGVNLKIVNPFYPMRLCKTGDEKECIRAALQKVHASYGLIEEILKDSTIQGDKLYYNGAELTSERVKQEVEAQLLAKDMINSEGIIVSCGAQAAIPHHMGEGPLYAHQTIICDIFPKDRSTGYFADMTRTYVKGEPTQEMMNLYEAVKKSQEAGESAVKAGVTGGSVHEVCAKVFLDLGYHVGDQGFIHGTGHGLGLDVHEGPNLKPGLDTVLEPGNVVTMEPGLYYAHIGGVRIEDVLYVTEDGCENLTNYPKQFIIQ